MDEGDTEHVLDEVPREDLVALAKLWEMVKHGLLGADDASSGGDRVFRFGRLLADGIPESDQVSSMCLVIPV